MPANFLEVLGWPTFGCLKTRPGALTTVTHYERFTFFYAQDRYEKETEIVIHPFVVSLVQTADRTASWILIQNFNFRGYTGDENHC